MQCYLILLILITILVIIIEIVGLHIIIIMKIHASRQSIFNNNKRAKNSNNMSHYEESIIRNIYAEDLIWLVKLFIQYQLCINALHVSFIVFITRYLCRAKFFLKNIILYIILHIILYTTLKHFFWLSSTMCSIWCMLNFQQRLCFPLRFPLLTFHSFTSSNSHRRWWRKYLRQQRPPTLRRRSADLVRSASVGAAQSTSRAVSGP